MKSLISLAPVPAVAAMAALALTGMPGRASAAGVERQGAEFPLTLRMPGDQVKPHIALGATWGLIAWEDAAIDGKGLGIAAMRLNETLSPEGGAFRVNETIEEDQENARVVLLPDGGAFFVWQGGPLGRQRIYGRVLGPDGTFATGDLPVSVGPGEHQLEANVAVLRGGNVVVVWSSYRQEGANYDVYGRIFSPSGEALTDEFRVNAELGLGRRSPTVAALGDGFVVAWIGERVVGQRHDRDASGRRVPGAGAPEFEVAVYARTFDADGTPTSGDRRLAGEDAIAAHPAIAPLQGGGFVLAWTRRHPTSREASLGIAARAFSAALSPLGEEHQLNTFDQGDQYRPVLAPAGSGVFAVWSDMVQDGSREGVFGTWLGPDGAPASEEFLVNTTTGGGQIFPSVAASPGGKLLVAWSSNLPQVGFELFAQRFVPDQVLAALPAPRVVPLSSSSAMITWPPLGGLDVATYRVYASDGPQLAEVEQSFWIMDGLPPAAPVSVQVAYVLASGEVSPRSPAGTGRTWGADRNFDGLPDDWQEQWWPGGPYPGGNEDSDGDGVRNLDEWLAGTDPTDPGSRLVVSAEVTALGLRITWPTEPGFIYQLQSSADGRNWSPVGDPRFAAGDSDSVTLPATEGVAFYRVLRVR